MIRKLPTPKMNNDSIRSFIRISEGLNQQPEQLLMEDFDIIPVSESNDHELITKLEDLIFKMKSYQSSDADSDSIGIELGMSMAADMLRNLLDSMGR